MPNGPIDWLRRHKAGTPVRVTASAQQVNRVSNILNDISGIGCTIIKETGANGKGWKIKIDGSSDEEYPPETEAPWGGDGWTRGGDYLQCYGESIGALSGVGVATSVIDLINRELEGGAWKVTNTTQSSKDAGALVVVGGVSASGGLTVSEDTGQGAGQMAEFLPDPTASANHADDFVNISVGEFATVGQVRAESYDYGTAIINGTFGIRHEIGANYSYIHGVASGTAGVKTTGDIEAGGVYKVGVNQVVGARGAAVTDPAGGATVDAEARTAIIAINNRLQAHGLIS